MVTTIFNAEFSLFAIIFLGFLAGKFKLLNQSAEVVLNQFVFYFSMPVLLFIAMANEPLQSGINLPFIYAFGIGSVVIFLLVFIFLKLFSNSNILQVNMDALAASSANTAFMGIPILTMLFGEKGVLPAAYATMLLVIVFIIAVIIVEVTKVKQPSLKKIYRQIIVQITKNPLIVSPILGLLFAATTYNLPKPINDFCHLLGAAATPCALFALGLSLTRYRFSLKDKSGLIVVGGSKLLLQPLVLLPLIFIFKVPLLWAASGLILSALPIATVVYVTAHQYRIHGERYAALVFETTVLSIITLAAVILIASHYWPGVFIR